jgi:hypothetical protein
VVEVAAGVEGVAVGVASGDGVTAVPAAEIEPSAETGPAACVDGPVVVLGLATAETAVAEAAEVTADELPATGGERVVAGAVPVGVTTSLTPVAFAVPAPVPRPVGAGPGRKKLLEPRPLPVYELAEAPPDGPVVLCSADG